MMESEVEENILKSSVEKAGYHAKSINVNS